MVNNMQGFDRKAYLNRVLEIARAEASGRISHEKAARELRKVGEPLRRMRIPPARTGKRSCGAHSGA